MKNLIIVILIIVILAIVIIKLNTPPPPCKPVKHCFKQTINSAPIMHRTKCPGESK